jgi:hypothetical protein
VRGLSSDTQQARMKEHLAGCPQCGEFVRMLQKLVAVVNKPLSRDVPDYVVHNAISIAALGRPEKVTFAAVVAKLIYDSFREPLPAGVRSQQTVSRQALYEAGEFSVDLRLEHERGEATVTLVGQVANRNQPGVPIANCPVLLFSGAEVVARAATDEYGEFQMKYRPGKHLRLQLPIASGEKWIEIRLADLSGDSPVDDPSDQHEGTK